MIDEETEIIGTKIYIRFKKKARDKVDAEITMIPLYFAANKKEMKCQYKYQQVLETNLQQLLYHLANAKLKI